MGTFGASAGWVTLGVLGAGLAAVAMVQAEEAPPLIASPQGVVEQDIRTVATQYWAWDRVSDAINWAPQGCVIWRTEHVFESSSEDKSTHGSKLYQLFSRLPKNYLELTGQAEEDNIRSDSPMRSGIGQVVVKESWKPVAVSEQEASEANSEKEPLVYAESPMGQKFRKGDFAGLFIMMKYDDPPIPADDGWVYATVAPDRTTILQSGRIDSCMGCHQNAPHGRLFGLAGGKGPSTKP